MLADGVCRRLSPAVVVCRLSSFLTLPAGGRVSRWARGRSTLHGGPVVLRPGRATPGLEEVDESENADCSGLNGI